MEKKPKIVQYRERLDKTLSSPDLTNEEILKTLVKNQLLHSPEQETEEYKEKVVESRTAEVSKFLDMLRSTSVDDSKRSNTSHADWKLKQDTEEFRVMYHEGPEGTPFHTLLVEGYVDGTVDVCLCISWETTLFKKWWPQSTVPTFKIIQSDCLQKIQMREQISLVRVKVSWPLSTREAVMHCYLFEYFQDDLIVGLMNTVPESKCINGTLNGFKNEEIPEARDAVRIDMMGGFALQKVASERSYFRTIANMDIKLDFVPPSLINFISRQLIGSGFRLYQKAVASMMNYDKEFSKTLRDPLYARIREALYDTVISERAINGEELKHSANICSGEDLKSKPAEEKGVHRKDRINQYAADKSTPLNAVAPDKNKASSEIEELDSEETIHFKEDGMKVNDKSIKEVETRSLLKDKGNVSISSEVEQALETLEKAISMVRRNRFHPRRSSSGFINDETSGREKGDTVGSYITKPSQQCSKSEIGIEVSDNDILEGRSQKATGTISDINSIRLTGANPNLRDVNYNKVVPASPEQNLSRPNGVNRVALCSLKNGATDNMPSVVIQDICSDEPKKSVRRGKYKYCCFLPQLKRN